jgi:hypothetical protein
LRKQRWQLENDYQTATQDKKLAIERDIAALALDIDRLETAILKFKPEAHN